MADDRTPNRTADMEKAAGERAAEQPERRDEANPGDRYGNRGEKGGGITNRPLDEEIENQEALPERGRSQEEERAGMRVIGSGEADDPLNTGEER